MSWCYPNINTDPVYRLLKGANGAVTKYATHGYVEGEMECCEGVCQVTAGVDIERNGEFWGALEIHIFTWNENGTYCYDTNDPDMRFIDIDGAEIKGEEIPRQILMDAAKHFEELGYELESYTADLLEAEEA